MRELLDINDNNFLVTKDITLIDGGKYLFNNLHCIITVTIPNADIHDFLVTNYFDSHDDFIKFIFTKWFNININLKIVILCNLYLNEGEYVYVYSIILNDVYFISKITENKINLFDGLEVYFDILEATGCYKILKKFN